MNRHENSKSYSWKRTGILNNYSKLFEDPKRKENTGKDKWKKREIKIIILLKLGESRVRVGDHKYTGLHHAPKTITRGGGMAVPADDDCP